MQPMTATERALAAVDTQRRASTVRLTIPAILIAFPAAIFYSVLFSNLINVPLLDDSHAVLKFINQMIEAKGALGKFQIFLASQDNEYKLFFGHGVEWAQYALLGHVSFVSLCMLGDSAVLVLALILWSMFMPGRKDLGKRLVYFVPVAWLVFQLEYFETLNWAMASLANLWVIVFSFGTIVCLLRPSRRAYAGALLLYALAIACLSNGFVLLPVGLLILATRRQLVRAAGFVSMTAVCIAAYAYHYNVRPSQPHGYGSVFAAPFHVRPGYVIAFIGNVGAIRGAVPSYLGFCIALGAGLLVIIAFLARRGYAQRNPAIAYCVLFILLTALGVAGLRSDFGLGSSLTPRYTIYGALLLVFVWEALAEEFLQHRREALLNNSPYLAAVLVSAFFGLCMDEIGYLNLTRRNHELVVGMASFEHSLTTGSDEGPLPALNVDKKINQEIRGILNESIRLGVYEPPKY